VFILTDVFHIPVTGIHGTHMIYLLTRKHIGLDNIHKGSILLHVLSNCGFILKDLCKQHSRVHGLNLEVAHSIEAALFSLNSESQ
jgi:hypothetical protein